MIKLINYTVLVVLFVLYSNQGFSQTQSRKIDVAICLDLSGSSNGLLKSFRDKIWEITSDFKNYNPKPEVRIALIVYGRSSFKEKTHYIRVITDFTSNIDDAMNALYNLRDDTDFGIAFVGRVIESSVDNLSWTKDPNALKTIFVVGNGSPEDGNVKSAEAGKRALNKNIIVNAIYNKIPQENRFVERWEKMAEDNKGIFAQITIYEPNIFFYQHFYNDLFMEVADVITSTYIYYGEKGREHYLIMNNLDTLSRNYSELAYTARVIYKGSDSYQLTNTSWDLVDYYMKYQCLPDKLNKLFLPKKYQKFTNKKLLDELDLRSRARYVCVEMINRLSKDRIEHFNRQWSKLDKFNVNKTVSSAIIEILRKHAANVGYKINTYNL